MCCTRIALTCRYCCRPGHECRAALQPPKQLPGHPRKPPGPRSTWPDISNTPEAPQAPIHEFERVFKRHTTKLAVGAYRTTLGHTVVYNSGALYITSSPFPYHALHIMPSHSCLVNHIQRTKSAFLQDTVITTPTSGEGLGCCMCYVMSCHVMSCHASAIARLPPPQHTL